MALSQQETKLIIDMASKVDELVNEATKSKNEMLAQLSQELKEQIAGFTQSDIVNLAKNQIDNYIKTTYGKLPEIFHVEYRGAVNKVTGIKHHSTERVLRKVVANVPVFMYGPSGSGKNIIAEQVSKALGLDFYYMNAVKQEFNLTGFTDARGRFIETPFYQACVNGGLMMIDEIDSSIPEVLVKLNAALANGYFDFPIGEDINGNMVGGRVMLHKETRFVVAGNTTGQGADRLYTGRNQLDASTLDRFAMVYIDYDSRMEEKIAGQHTDLLKFIHALRSVINRTEMRYVMSIRALKNSIALIENGADTREVLEDAIVKGINKIDLQQILSNLSSQGTSLRGNQYYEELQVIVNAKN